MGKPMTRWGAGPRMGLAAMVWIAPACVLRYVRPDVFRFPWVPYALLAAVGGALLAAGLALLAWSAGPVHRAYGANRLLTAGPYALCRNPLYAAWALLVYPGVMLLTNSWIGFVGTPVIVLGLRRLVRPEEVWLEARFGEAYREYRRRTPAFLPFGRRRREG